MKALKALVIFLGVLIVAGVGLVIYGVSSKIGPKPASAPTVSIAADAPFGSVDIPLPDGASVQQIFAAGDRVIVRVGTGTGNGAADRLIVLDPAHGRIAGSFGFTTGPGAAAKR